MSRYVFVTAALVFVWVILTESLSWFNILIGSLVAGFVLLFVAKLLPIKKITDVRFSRLALFPFYLIGQIYVAGFYVIKVLLTGHEVAFVTVRTTITSETLKIILGDAVTLTPGSVLIELSGDEMFLLWIRSKKTPPDPEIAGDQLKGKLEQRLLKAQKQDVSS